MSLPHIQLHLAGSAGNWMQLKPQFQGKDGSKISGKLAQKPLPQHDGHVPALCQCCWNKGREIKASLWGTPGLWWRINGSKGPFKLCGSGFEK